MTFLDRLSLQVPSTEKGYNFEHQKSLFLLDLPRYKRFRMVLRSLAVTRRPSM